MAEQPSSCLISDVRSCHTKNQENLVFVIGLGSAEFEKDVDSVREVLYAFGLTGYFALLSENEKGLDAFCDKICSKIRSSRFCIAILNDPIVSKTIEGNDKCVKSVRVPSANVYYEFGMAVAFGKKVIPLARYGHKLPFDVQHLDSIIYTNSDELKSNLEKVIAATLIKKPRKAIIVNEKIIESIYGPLYNEIMRFLSERDRFSSFNHPQYGNILTSRWYLFDTIDEELRKEIVSFFKEIDEFNVLLEDSERIINRIVLGQILDVLGEKVSKNNSVSIELETDSTIAAPTIEQILIRNTTPELFYEAQGLTRIIRKITFKLTTEDYRTKEIPLDVFKPFFEKCREMVENNPRVARLRELRKNLVAKAEVLKQKLGSLCR